MPFVEGNGVSGHEPPHDFAEWGKAGAQKEMEMIWNQGPGITMGLGLFKNNGQTIKE